MPSDRLIAPSVGRPHCAPTGCRPPAQPSASDTVTKPAHYYQLRRDTALRRRVLTHMFMRGQLEGFHVDHFFVGQGIVDYPRWVKANESYPIPFQEGVEPYVLRRFVPWCDERFRGYGFDKVIHFLHMHSLGLQFRSCSQGYAVHTPHPECTAFSVTQATGQWNKLLQLYSACRAEMVACTFVPATSFACASGNPEVLLQSYHTARHGMTRGSLPATLGSAGLCIAHCQCISSA
ncbi:Glycosyltransferase LARGE1 isoform A [Micractinium conductrix]|uniref:Glycosyltransferase LARGE1 isoform A n=1 Tax=Micractinium conductrix TaxID=554055 RepID=A0A2P6V7F6_9CHLO|nr:Glycosyltransferase LARGE1 isoform A [Micractinium conductrix]|eukprot:PSC70016.1 Glycosyltransferase LARGE1 isoform A [Micractinium conductrix]